MHEKVTIICLPLACPRILCANHPNCFMGAGETFDPDVHSTLDESLLEVFCNDFKKKIKLTIKHPRPPDPRAS